MTIPTRYRKAHRRTARALLIVIREAVRALREAVRPSTLRVLAALTVLAKPDPERVVSVVAREAPLLRSTVERSLSEIRLTAKRSSAERIGHEWATVVKDGASHGVEIPVDLPNAALTPTDIEASESSAASLAAAWSRGLAAAAWLDVSGASIRAAARAHGASVRRTATTEAAQAFQDARDEGMGWVAQRYGAEQWFPAVFKSWDATNDSRLCARCGKRDGEVKPVGASFSGGAAPGHEHPCCRCVEGLVFIPARIRGDATEGRYVDDERPREAA